MMKRQITYVAMALLASVALAQFQVNRQITGQPGGRVNGELYGNQGTSGSMRYAAYQTNLLPSEARYATWRSGALPSEMRMNAIAVGPLAPGGSMAYIPGQSTLQRAMNLPPPQLYNPAYIKPAQVNAAVAPIASSGGTIRYANQLPPVPSVYQVNAASTAGSLPSAQLPTGQLPTGQINAQLTQQVKPVTAGALMLSQSSINLGSIKYNGSTAP